MAALLARRWARPTSSTLTAPRQLWTAVAVTTADGVTARLQVELTREVTGRETQPDVRDASAVAAVETALRRTLGARRAASLPVKGSTLDRVELGLVDDVTIGDVFVVVCDVEVTGELKRILAPESTR